VLAQVAVRMPPVEYTKDTLKVVKENVAKNQAVLVDVRSESEWKKGNIEGAIFLPVDSLTKKTDPKELAKKLPKDKVLYTFCVVGMRAKTAAQKLQQYGYTVRALKPGYDQLLEAGFVKARPQPASASANHDNTRQRNAG
jgi:rhodanese-related sulfurtransferase